MKPALNLLSLIPLLCSFPLLAKAEPTAAAPQTVKILCAEMTHPKYLEPYLRYGIVVEHGPHGVTLAFLGSVLDSPTMYAERMQVTSVGTKTDPATGIYTYSFKAKKQDDLGAGFFYKWEVQGSLIFNPKDPAHSVFRHKSHNRDMDGRWSDVKEYDSPIYCEYDKPETTEQK